MRRAALALVAAVACRRAPTTAAPPPDAPRPVAPPASLGPDDPTASYRIMEVRGGVTLRGHVRWRGALPRPEAMAVPPHGDPGHCGASQALEPLTVGPDGGVLGAVVSLRIRRGKAPRFGAVTVDQRRCRYEPRVSSITVGAALRFTNSDPDVFHNVHAYYGEAGEDAWFNEASPAGVAIERRVERAGVVRLVCDSGHTWMVAYVHAFNHPYHTVTDATGAYAIPDVPPGAYEVAMWHEGWARRDRAGDPRPAFVDHVTLLRSVDVHAPEATADFELADGARPALEQVPLGRVDATGR
ncbi:MAG: carboxypeptidase regulatory-like domain-containing protein [Polyangiales bacterium]